MAENLLPAPASSAAVLQTVRWAIVCGFDLVPLLSRSKSPVSGNYAKPGYVSPDESYWESRECGVGVVTGPRFHGPVDIDIDGGNDARYFSDLFLPKTPAAFGRASNPASHRLYFVDAAAFDKFALLDPLDRSTIIEARGDGGHQTMLPGSIHPSGEEVKWAGSTTPEIPTCLAASLTRAVRKVALACLIARHVWKPGYHNEPCMHLSGMFYYSNWPEDEAAELMQAVMDYTGDRDSSRIPTLKHTFARAARGQKVTAGGRLREQVGPLLVDKLFELMADPDQETLAAKIAYYNEHFAVVDFAGRFRIARTDSPAGTTPLFMEKGDFLNLRGADFFIDKDQKVRRTAEIWLRSPQACNYSAVENMPGQDESDSNCFNLWTGFAIPPAEGRCDAWLELLRYVCGSSESTEWMLHWLANIIREPQGKPGTAVVVVGRPGAGKTTLIQYFGEILGDYYVPVTHESHLTGNFNAHRASALLLHSEEALYGGDKRHRGIIKSLITDAYQMLELKGVDAKRIKSFARLILSSNNENPAPVEPGDRRFTIFDMGRSRASDALVQAVLNEREHLNGQAALHTFLRKMDYRPQIPRLNLKSEAAVEITARNLDPLDAAWLDILRRGELLPYEGKWCQRPEPTDSLEDRTSLLWPRMVSMSAIHRYIELRLRNKCPSAQVCGVTIKKKYLQGTATEVYATYTPPEIEDLSVPQDWRRDLSSRQRSINLPPLEDCRRMFEEYVGQPIAWGSDEEIPQILIKKPRVGRPGY